MSYYYNDYKIEFLSRWWSNWQSIADKESKDERWRWFNRQKKSPQRRRLWAEETYHATKKQSKY
jgi:hypothetical protein